jgi:DNA-directed RNA polymerase specialized sigma24 family protein
MRMNKRDQSGDYVKNKDLKLELITYKQTGIVSERLGGMLMTIARNYCTKGNFSGYTWKQDMISDAVLSCMKYMKNFNEEKSSNAFAYITKICHNAFIAHIKKQNKHSEIKDICYNEFQEYSRQYESPHADVMAMNYEKMKR